MGATILIVDDEENLRKTLSRILTKAGYSVTTASNGEEGLGLLQAGAYELAFIDLLMPGIGGVVLLQEIHAIYPEMPVLILTAHGSLETAIEAVREGARDYILKPADPQLILDRVKEILDEQRQPYRQREILGQIQNLVSELHDINQGGDDQFENKEKFRPPTDPTRFLQRGRFTLDLHVRILKLDEKYIPLSPSNFDYLATMLRHSPNAVSYEVLVRESQGYDLTRNEAREMARWRIHELRKDIEADPKNPKQLITVRGSGYRLVVD